MGQLKWIATNSYAELEAYLPGSAGAELRTVLENWLTDGTNYALVNIGQLKFLASLFYDRLIEEGYTNAYPWIDDPTNANDFAMANIGQVKNVFSFDLTKDTDSDGMPDWWEVANGLNPSVDDSGEDPDNDGLTNLEEYQNGTDPKAFDTDGDGMPDGWEVNNGLNPRADDAAVDSDEDGLINFEEFQLHTDPQDRSDGQALLESTRVKIINHWHMVMDTQLVFTNAPGSTADLADLKDALNTLFVSGKLYGIKEQ